MMQAEAHMPGFCNWRTTEAHPTQPRASKLLAREKLPFETKPAPNKRANFATGQTKAIGAESLTAIQMPAKGSKKVEAETPRLTNFLSRARCCSSASELRAGCARQAIHSIASFRGMQVKPR
jgi:hypothetical protein